MKVISPPPPPLPTTFAPPVSAFYFRNLTYPIFLLLYQRQNYVQCRLKMFTLNNNQKPSCFFFVLIYVHSFIPIILTYSAHQPPLHDHLGEFRTVLSPSGSQHLFCLWVDGGCRDEKSKVSPGRFDPLISQCIVDLTTALFDVHKDILTVDVF